MGSSGDASPAAPEGPRGGAEGCGWGGARGRRGPRVCARRSAPGSPRHFHGATAPTSGQWLPSTWWWGGAGERYPWTVPPPQLLTRPALPGAYAVPPQKVPAGTAAAGGGTGLERRHTRTVRTECLTLAKYWLHKVIVTPVK